MFGSVKTLTSVLTVVSVVTITSFATVTSVLTLTSVSMILCDGDCLINFPLKSCDFWSLKRGEFHISHDASRLISIFSSRLKKSSRVSREIFNELNFKMDLIKGKFQ